MKRTFGAPSLARLGSGQACEYERIAAWGNKYLVEQYKEQTQQIPPASDAEMLRHLLEAQGVTQVEVAQETGMIESTISAVLSGKRRLTRDHIGKLSRYFKVSPSVFKFSE
jgi:HTH-type transcriptional regulator / antitoxin HigA